MKVDLSELSDDANLDKEAIVSLVGDTEASYQEQIREDRTGTGSTDRKIHCHRNKIAIGSSDKSFPNHIHVFL